LYKLLISVFLTSIALIGFSQEPIFNINNANKIYFNPAFAGYRGTRVGLNYLNQHNKSIKNYNTGLLTVDRDFRDLDGLNISGVFLYDDYGNGIKNLLSAHIILEYNITIDRYHNISIAVQPGYGSSKTNLPDFPNRYYPGNMANVAESLNVKNEYFDLSTGVLFYSRDYFVGASFYHINNPVESNLPSGKKKLPVRFSGQAGYDFYIRKKFRITPSVMYQFQNKHFYNDSINDYLIDPLNDLTFSMDLFNDTLRFGIGYHYMINNPDVYFARVGVHLGRIEVIYEYGFSPYTCDNNRRINNFHNIGLEINFPSRRLTGKVRIIGCPSF
jgi:type IX secretion system PorP/SprF family membrane protein